MGLPDGSTCRDVGVGLCHADPVNVRFDRSKHDARGCQQIHDMFVLTCLHPGYEVQKAQQGTCPSQSEGTITSSIGGGTHTLKGSSAVKKDWARNSPAKDKHVFGYGNGFVLAEADHPRDAG